MPILGYRKDMAFFEGDVEDFEAQGISVETIEAWVEGGFLVQILEGVSPDG